MLKLICSLISNFSHNKDTLNNLNNIVFISSIKIYLESFISKAHLIFFSNSSKYFLVLEDV
jgi:hypothetical protein